MVLLIDYTIAGALVTETATRDEASWYIRGDGDELRTVVTEAVHTVAPA